VILRAPEGLFGFVQHVRFRHMDSFVKKKGVYMIIGIRKRRFNSSFCDFLSEIDKPKK
jgi:hypothetical protein